MIVGGNMKFWLYVAIGLALLLFAYSDRQHADEDIAAKEAAQAQEIRKGILRQLDERSRFLVAYRHIK